MVASNNPEIAEEGAQEVFARWLFFDVFGDLAQDLQIWVNSAAHWSGKGRCSVCEKRRIRRKVPPFSA